MTDRERQLGKLIVLRRVREEREREALGAAARAEDDARAREDALDLRSRATAAELDRAAQAEEGDRPPAQVLQFRGRYSRYLQRLAEQLEVQLAASRSERIGATEAAARIRVRMLEARRARELLEERLAAARRDRRRRREEAAAREQDDAPGPPRRD